MDVSRMGRGEQIAAVGGIVLIISLFLDWAGGFNGWELNNTLDIYLLITAAVAIIAAVTPGDSLPLPGVTINGAAALLGAVAAILLVWLIIFDWPDGAGREFGVILALIASAAVAYGGYESA
ncbi:hypothetical protein BH20ACT15_BH20ACT15_05880 [soil metagenome]